MNVLMFTNTFVPHVGGVTRSILTLKAELERRGHRVLVVAPAYDGHRQDAPGVLRVPAIRDLAGSGYATPIPMSRHIRDEIDDFAPDVIHAHHPFLLGDTALRTAASLGVPSVYTCHTRYDHYLGALASADGRLARLMRQLTNGFADLADAVIAPSESIRAQLLDAGVSSPVRVVATGIDLERMRAGDGAAMRARLGLSPGNFVVGHLGRLAVEKNLDYLAQGVALFLEQHPSAHFIVAGRGPQESTLREVFTARGVAARLLVLGTLDGADFASFYAAMDVFAFASLSETQGLVVAEAMAAGTPVVALDAPGVRESLDGGKAGTLLAPDTDPAAFAGALAQMAGLAPDARAERRRIAQNAAGRFSIPAMGDGVETLYRDLIAAGRREPAQARAAWEASWAGLAAEAGLVENLLHAIGVALRPSPGDSAPPGAGDWEAGRPDRRLAVALISLGFALALRALRASWRLDTGEAPRLDAASAAGERLAALFWHGNYLPLFSLLAGRSALVATSRSFRGAVIAAIARRFGYRTVQISGRPHHAGDCLRAELARPGGFVAIAADGPLGPRHVVKTGAIAIAARAGAKVVPVAAEASASLRLSRRWDHMELPLPFARVALRIGLPMEIDARDSGDIEAAADREARRLLALRVDP